MMKGKLKQLISILLISVLVLSMAAPGFAASEGGSGTHTLTISSQTDGHTFELYQIFKGDVATDSNSQKVLTNIEWGESIDSYTSLVAALKTDSTLSGYFASVDTTGTANKQAVAVAAGLSETLKDNSAADLADYFAEFVNNCLKETEYKSTNTGSRAGDGVSYVYTIDDIADGYYLLKDADKSLTGDDTAAYTKYIIGIIGDDEKIDAKADKPNIDKHIVNPHSDTDPELEKTEEYSIGDTITYQLNSRVPEMDGYERYWFMAQDTLSKGLTFIDMKSVTVDGAELTKNGTGTNSYTYSAVPNSDGTTSLYIILNNFLESYKDKAGKDIVIQYNVKLNEFAEVGASGNINTVNLIYSNNPYADYKGEPTPGGENPGTGHTTNKTTLTYTTKISILKVDANTKDPLGEVSFSLSSGSGDTTKPVYTLTTTQEFGYAEADNGNYVKVGDSYVEYDENTHGTSVQRYTRKVTSTDTDYIITTEGTGTETVSGVTGSDGKLTFTGLGAGTYTLTETGTPSGYNLLTDPITLEITYTDPTNFLDQWSLTAFDQPDYDIDKAMWSYKINGESVSASSDNVKLDSDGSIVITVTNTSSALLPSTGGVGTIIFTVAGLCVMVGAVVFLYTKKRKEEL